MFEFILGFINWGTLLLFGVFVSASFLGIILNKRNVITLSIFSACAIALQVVCYKKIGYDATAALYPIIIHLPLILLFVFLYKKKPLSSSLAVMSAYLCCQISNWIGIVTLTVSHEPSISYAVRIVVILFTGWLLIRYTSSSLQIIFTKPQKDILTFSILPISYYLFDYGTTVYTDLLYRGYKAVFEFLPFMLCVSYLVFCVLYFMEYEKKCEIKRHNQLMEMQRLQSEKELKTIKRSEYAVSLIHHDMRHFLNNISTFIENGESDKAQNYISEIITATERTAMKKYCNNGIVNTILSSYENEIEKKAIDLQCTIKIPNELPFSNVDITSILSNGLENAIHAVSELKLENRCIMLNLCMNNGKLLLSIKNPYSNKPEVVNGFPHTSITGHGLGTQSISYVTEKLNGSCQFTINDDVFMLRVIL